MSKNFTLLTKIVVLTSVIISCTKVEFRDVGTVNYIDDDFALYVDGFEQNYGREIPSNVTMIFSELEPGRAGACDKLTKEVKIDKSIWGTLTVERQEALIFHELGHCVLSKEHTSDTAISFMTPDLQSFTFYSLNREDLFKDLFDTDDVVLYELPQMPETKVQIAEPLWRL